MRVEGENLGIFVICLGFVGFTEVALIVSGNVKTNLLSPPREWGGRETNTYYLMPW